MSASPSDHQSLAHSCRSTGFCPLGAQRPTAPLPAVGSLPSASPSPGLDLCTAVGRRAPSSSADCLIIRVRGRFWLVLEDILKFILKDSSLYLFFFCCFAYITAFLLILTTDQGNFRPTTKSINNLFHRILHQFSFLVPV